MTCTPAQLAANRANSALSTGPKTEAGKEASRQNSLKHGLTGEGIVQRPADAEASADLTAKLLNELKPKSEIGKILVERMGVLGARLRRCAVEERNQLEAGISINILEGTPQAILFWKYELAAEKGLFRTLKEFRAAEGKPGNPNATSPAARACKQLGSSLQAATEGLAATLAPAPAPAPTPSVVAEVARTPLPKPLNLPTNNVALSIGKPPK